MDVDMAGQGLSGPEVSVSRSISQPGSFGSLNSLSGRSASPSSQSRPQYVQGPPTPSMSVSAPHTSQHANNADQKLDADVPMGDNVKALPAQAASSPYNSTIPLRARYTTVRSSLPSLNPCEMFFTTAVESEDKPFIEGYLQVCLAGTDDWSTNYFLVKDNFLIRAANETTKTISQGLIPLSGAVLQRRDEHPRMLQLTALNNANLFLRAKDEQMRNQWYSLLYAASKLTIHSRYIIHKTLGSGTFSIVKLVTHKVSRKKYALKVIAKDALKMKGCESLITEIMVLKRSRHPNVVSLYEIFETDKHLYLVMELLQGGELFDAIIERGKFTEQHASEVIRDIVKGVSYLHSLGIVHRDIKPENLLYDQPGPNATIKLTDFGLSKMLQSASELMSTKVGTPNYVAPEVIDPQPYTKAVDMWSVGVVLYVLLCGYPPFGGQNTAVLFHNICTAQVTFPEQHWGKISSSAKDLISQLLQKDPARRPTPEQVLQHPWITKPGADRDLSDVKTKVRSLLARRRLKQHFLGVVAMQFMKPAVSPRTSGHHSRSISAISHDILASPMDSPSPMSPFASPSPISPMAASVPARPSTVHDLSSAAHASRGSSLSPSPRRRSSRRARTNAAAHGRRLSVPDVSFMASRRPNSARSRRARFTNARTPSPTLSPGSKAAKKRPQHFHPYASPVSPHSPQEVDLTLPTDRRRTAPGGLDSMTRTGSVGSVGSDAGRGNPSITSQGSQSGLTAPLLRVHINDDTKSDFALNLGGSLSPHSASALENIHVHKPSRPLSARGQGRPRPRLPHTRSRSHDAPVSPASPRSARSRPRRVGGWVHSALNRRSGAVDEPAPSAVMHSNAGSSYDKPLDNPPGGGGPLTQSVSTPNMVFRDYAQAGDSGPSGLVPSLSINFPTNASDVMKGDTFVGAPAPIVGNRALWVNTGDVFSNGAPIPTQSVPTDATEHPDSTGLNRQASDASMGAASPSGTSDIARAAAAAVAATGMNYFSVAGNVLPHHMSNAHGGSDAMDVMSPMSSNPSVAALLMGRQESLNSLASLNSGT